MKHTILKPLLASLLVTIGGLSLLGQLARLETPLGTLSLYEPLMGVFVLLSACLPLPKLSRKGTAPLLWLISWAGWTLFTTIMAASTTPELFVVGGAYLARLTLTALFVLCVLHIQGIFGWQKWLQAGLLIWLSLQAIIGVGQYLLLPDTRLFFYLGWDDHLSRAFGTLFDPTFFGILMVFGALQVLHAERLAGVWRSLLLALFLAALSLSFSRAVALAFVVGVIVSAFSTRNRRVLLLIPLLIASLVLIPRDGGGEGQNLLRTRSAQIRAEVVTHHTKTLSWRELFVGRGWYYERVLATHQAGLGQVGAPAQLPANSGAVDVSLLHVLLSTGIIGALFFSGFLLSLLHSLKGFALGQSVYFALLTHSFFALSLFYPWVTLLAPFYLFPSFWVNSQVPTIKAIKPNPAKITKSNQSG